MNKSYYVQTLLKENQYYTGCMKFERSKHCKEFLMNESFYAQILLKAYQYYPGSMKFDENILKKYTIFMTTKFQYRQEFTGINKYFYADNHIVIEKNKSGTNVANFLHKMYLLHKQSHHDNAEIIRIKVRKQRPKISQTSSLTSLNEFSNSELTALLRRSNDCVQRTDSMTMFPRCSGYFLKYLPQSFKKWYM